MSDDLLASNGLDWKPLSSGLWERSPIPPPSERIWEDKGAIHSVHRELEEEGRYTKEILETVVIDSRDRNIDRYPYPNDFIINVGGQFENVKQIVLTGVDIDNTTPPIHQCNNSIQWSYPRECDVDPAGQLVPGIPNADLPTTFFASERICYSANVPIGFYTVNELERATMDSMNQVLHSMADTGEYDLAGQAHSFYMESDTSTHEVDFVDRILLREPVMIQTILDTQGDILAPFVITATCPPDPTALFLTVPGEATWTGGQYYPLVLTNVSTVGGVPNEFINLVEYWETSLGIDAPSFEYCDTLLIGTTTFTRYKLFPRNRSGEPIAPSFQQNIPLTTSLEPFLNMPPASAGDFIYPFDTPRNANVINNVSDINAYITPAAGLALPFAFNPSPELPPDDCRLDANCRPRKVSLLLQLGWYPRATGYRFVHRNEGPDGQIPFRLINWERNAVGDYILSSERYIFIRISIPSRPDHRSGGNMIKGVSQNRETNYSNAGFFKEPRQDANERSLTSLFAKIQLASTQPNRSHISISSPLKYYDQPLDRLTELRVELVDRNGVLVNVRSDWNFDLTIFSLREVLANTLIDTRTGKYITTGYQQNY